MKTRTNGIDLNYEITGSEKAPWITLSHSLACNLHMWDDQMDLLTRKFRVLRFDTRGHGQSSAPAGEYTLDQMADDWLAKHDPDFLAQLEEDEHETEDLFVTGDNAKKGRFQS